MAYKYPFSLFKYVAPLSILVLVGVAGYLLFFLDGIPRLLISLLFLYRAINDSLAFYISLTPGPESFIIESDDLIMKPRFRKVIRRKLDTISCIEELKWLDYIHSYSIVMRFQNGLGNVYLHRGLTDLGGFLREIVRAKPDCKVRGEYLQGLLKQEGADYLPLTCKWIHHKVHGSSDALMQDRSSRCDLRSRLSG